ncbi:MAG: PD-(D/E)XK nuclease family protein [candidate division WOR-3 bacterium]
MRFLEKLVDLIVKENEDLLVILPSKRSILYLKEEFKKKKIDTMLPDLKTMEDFVQEVSGLRIEDNLELLGLSYRIYKNMCKEVDFKDFVKIFDIFLNDFNDIDLYLLDKKKIENIEILNQYENSGKKYLDFMNVFEKVYSLINEELDKKNSGYRGRIYRKASEKSKDFKKYKNVIIAGFGIFTPSEQKIIDNLIKNCNVKIVFDTQQKLIEKDFESVKFIKEYLNKWEKNGIIIDTYLNEEISIYSSSSSVSQIHLFESVLNDKQTNATVVLPDETLLFPVISGIPSYINKINITMGFPFEQTPIARFVLDILKMHCEKNEKGFYYKDVLNVIESTYIKQNYKHKKFLKSLEEKIDKGITFIGLDEKFDDEFLQNIFEWYSNNKFLSPLEILKKILNIVLMVGHREESENRVIEEANSVRMVQILNRMISFVEKYKDIEFGNIENLETLETLIRRMIKNEKVPYSGDPLQDFQIMGVLETRCLDFEKTIILSVNEGIIPKGKDEKTFIPYDLRVIWGLPTYRENDILFSYYFYSLLFKSKKFYISYSTGGDVDFKERSRFIEQILYENRKGGIFENIKINFSYIDYYVENKVCLEEIEKNDSIIEILKEKKFSPTALITYLRNPIDFYYNFVLGVKEENEPGEVGADIIGTAAHSILKELYSNLQLKKEMFKEKDIEKILENIKYDKIIENDFKNNKINDSSFGKPLLMKEMIKKMVKDFLRYDLERVKNGLEICEVEKEIEITEKFSGFDLKLKGTIDRIEKENGNLRICDYKTGSIQDNEMKLKNEDFDFAGEKSLENFEKLKGNPEKYSKLFQLLFYAYIINKERGKNREWEKFGLRIYSLRKPKRFFDAEVGNDKLIVDDEVLKNFENLLKLIFEEIFDKSVKFLKKEKNFELKY